MCPTTVAQVMMESMIQVAKDKAASGNYADAVTSISNFIGSIENNNENVQRTFGTNLVLLYCLRAKLQFEASIQCNDTAKLELARNDVKKAEEALDKFVIGIDSVQRENLRENIKNVINADDELRNDSLATVMQFNTSSLPSAEKASRPKAKPSRSLLEDYGKSHYTVCPHCQASLGSHHTTFGPASVECFNCGKTVQTGLTPWADLSIIQKLTTALGEIVAPTYVHSNRLQSCLETFIPLFFIVPFINIWRLFQAIGESNYYSRTGTPPVWKPRFQGGVF